MSTPADLRKPFPPELIGQLPKAGITLDFVGHAATTDRLLTVDPTWTWEPFGYDPQGLPALDEHGGLWIKLTVLGITRPGYGDATGKKGPNAVKEAIGDAIRNAAMRFGVALDLWAKEDLWAQHNRDRSAVKTDLLDLFLETGMAEPAAKVAAAAVWDSVGITSRSVSDDQWAQLEAAARERIDV